LTSSGKTILPPPLSPSSNEFDLKKTMEVIGASSESRSSLLDSIRNPNNLKKLRKVTTNQQKKNICKCNKILN